MKNKKTEALLLGLSLLCYFAMSLTFLFMPLEKDTFVSGIVFWTGLVGGSVMQIMLNAQRKDFFRKNNISYKNTKKSRAGIARFFTNRPAKIADVSFCVSSAN